jgi:Fe-S-cluster containining protein
MALGKNAEVCRLCGAYCCSLGGTAATKDEKREIIAKGHPDYFVQVSENCYVTEWGEEGVCPYLDGRFCTIYRVRPRVCRKFPVVSFDKKVHFIAHCPLAKHLSASDVDRLIELSESIPREIIEGSKKYLIPHAEIIEDRIRGFDLEKIIQIL